MFSLDWWFKSPEGLKMGLVWGFIAFVGKVLIVFGAFGVVRGALIVVSSEVGEGTPVILSAAVGIVLAVAISFVGRGITAIAYHMAAKGDIE